jgi:hypothetical protein
LLVLLFIVLVPFRNGPMTPNQSAGSGVHPNDEPRAPDSTGRAKFFGLSQGHAETMTSSVTFARCPKALKIGKVLPPAQGEAVQFRSLFAVLSLSLAAVACAGNGAPAQPAPGSHAVQHAVTASIKLTLDSDGQNVSFPTQNGSLVPIASRDLIGKTVYWVTTPGGEPVSNAEPIDSKISTIGADLTSSMTTAAHYGAGPFEVACVISVTGAVPPAIPAPGDLAAFDNSTPPKGDPPPTGVSVRFHVADRDANVTLSNASFIRFGK